jgi:hypothetical protein
LDAAGWDCLRTGPVGSVAALRGVAASLAAVPETTCAGDVLDGPVLDRRALLQVLAVSSHGAAGDGKRSRKQSPGVPALAEAMANAWLAVRDAARDGVELTSVERTIAALFPDRPGGECEGPGTSGAAPGCPDLDLLPELAEALRVVTGHARPAPGGANCLALEPADFEAVIDELERRCHIPLLLEARRCRTPAELVALVRTQLTSGA